MRGDDANADKGEAGEELRRQGLAKNEPSKKRGRDRRQRLEDSDPRRRP